MAPADPQIHYDLASNTFVAGNKTATGPYPIPEPATVNTGYVPADSSTIGGFGVTFPCTTDVTIDWNPPATIQFPDPTFAKGYDINGGWKVISRQLAASMAEGIDDLIMNGPKPHKKEKKKMPKNDERTLYNVFVIDPEGDGKVVAILENIVARDVAAAEKKAVFELASNPQTAEKLEKDLEEYDFLTEDVADFGSIRPK